MKDYLSLLIAIQNNPFGTTDELSSESDISKPTVIKRLRVLQGEKRLIPEEDPKKYFSVKPILNYSALGLEPVDILAETSDLQSTEILENVAYEHPYTAYRSRCFGNPNGVLFQFRTPAGTSNLIQELFEILWNRGTISGYHILPVKDSILRYTSMQLTGWNENDSRWEFDWKRWFKASTRKRVESHKTSTSVLETLTKDDLHILRELMVDSRRKNLEIIEQLAQRGVDFTPQTYSRHQQMIKDQCTLGFRVAIDPEPFDVLTNLLVIGTADSEYLQELVAKTQFIPFPFESTIRISNNHLFWYIRLNQDHVSPLLNGLFEKIENMRVCFLDYRNSFLYNIWPDAFDEEEKEWRVDRAFMIDRVTDSL
ncbi:MAG: hypothetical protein GF411_02355 [Candidatus Lokiarchaeota archaeon]|nr:hypothetical protein [Candidatus Lokiarchaeota archaeon]